MSYVSAALRKQVIDRAESKCEYCKFPQALSFFTFEMEHIISKKHDSLIIFELRMRRSFHSRQKDE